MINEKVLYFEGAGIPEADVSVATVGNCRIRTAFHLNDGRPVYLEILGIKNNRDFRCNVPCSLPYVPKYAGFIESCHYISGSSNDCCKNRIDFNEYISKIIDYSFNGICQFVNSLGCSFDRIEVLNNLDGFRVFKDRFDYSVDSYNYGDVFVPDRELIEHRERIYNYIYNKEIERGEKFPCFSLWVDENEPAALHYHNCRKSGSFSGTFKDSIIYAGVPSDVSVLPTLERFNAIEGAYYSLCSGPFFVESVYSISEKFAIENDLYLLDRVKISTGEDFALPCSRVRA